MNLVTPATTMQQIVEEMAETRMPLSMQTLTYELEGETHACTVVIAQGPLSDVVQEMVHQLGARLEASGGAESRRIEYPVDPDEIIH